MTPEVQVFVRLGDVAVDSRRRVSLGRFGIDAGKRFTVSVNRAGVILLAPVALIEATT